MSEQPPVENRRKVFTKQITLGNVLSMISTLCGGVSVIVIALNAWSDFKNSTDKRLTLVEAATITTSRILDNQQRQMNIIFEKLIPGEHAQAEGYDNGNP